MSQTRPPVSCRPATALPVLTALIVAIVSSLLLTLAGCASTAGIEPAAKTVSVNDLGLNVADTASPVPADWWQRFGDAGMSDLIARALEGNPNLKVAQARLARSQAAVESASSAQGLKVDASGQVIRERFTVNGLYPPPLGGGIYNEGTLRLGASWEFDFFGRDRRALDAAVGAQRAAQADTQAARVMLASNVARNYVQLARLVEQREVARRSLAQRDEMLTLIRQRFDAGLDTKVELRQGEGALPETRTQLEALDEQITLARHALAALAAQPPQAYEQLTPQLKTVQLVPLPASVPADLLGRRADISAARWRVEAATDDVASAKAQFYPNVNLSAVAGLSSLGLDKLFRGDSREWNVGPAIHLPIFDAGRLRANLRGKSADLDVAVESYNAAVIDALRDVADQIASLQSIARQQAEQVQAQAAAESAYDIGMQRYKAGLGTYLTVLNAEASVLAQRRLATDLKARTLDTQVALIRSLGGGYAADATQTAAVH